MTSIFAQTLDSALKQHIYAVLNAHKNGEPLPEMEPDFIPDSFGAICERLAIEHVRGWHIEDQIGDAIKRGDEASVFHLKCKLDTCWKNIRPRLVSAANRKANDAILHVRSLVEESVKLYKGYADIDAKAETAEPKEINFLKLIEEIAKAIHDGWLEEKRRLCYKFGPRDEENRTHPHFVPWEELESKDQDRFWAAMIIQDWVMFGKRPIRSKDMHEAWKFWPRLNGVKHPHDEPFEVVHAHGSLEHELQAELVNKILLRFRGINVENL